MRTLLIILALTASLSAAPVPKAVQAADARRQSQELHERVVKMLLEAEASDVEMGVLGFVAQPVAKPAGK